MDKMGGQAVGRWLRETAKSAATAALGASLLLAATAAPAREIAPQKHATVAVADLPAQAQDTHRLIRVGGPFPHAKDGSVFGNRERRLPSGARGYYREYTVATPGVSSRGARRIVCGGREPRSPDACYYTQDHYASFRRISQ